MFLPRLPRLLFLIALALLAGCVTVPEKLPEQAPAACVPCTCPVCPGEIVKPPPAKPFAAAPWADLPGWPDEDPAPALTAFIASCDVLGKRTLWKEACAEARTARARGLSGAALRAWFERQFAPWQVVNPDGSREGMITGYYEPVLKGSRQRRAPYLEPLYGVPDDLLTIDLGDLYPELKGLRLRGRLEGRKVVPYDSRAEIAREGPAREKQALLWIDDAIDLFFMQVQGSGQVQLDDGSRIRVTYADQNGHPYRSIGRWLADQKELKLDQTSMQGIKAWARNHPQRLQEMLDANPSVVFFREATLDANGPPGALGVPLTAERSLAIDPRILTLGAPIWLATTYPASERALTRLMLAQDTGGAIRGAVRADFFWGSGPAAGEQAGRMRQSGRMWMLLPAGQAPAQAPK